MQYHAAALMLHVLYFILVKPPSSMTPLWVYVMAVTGIITVLTVLVLFVLSVAICR